METSRLPRCDFEGRALVLSVTLLVNCEVKAISPVVDRVLELAERVQCSTGKELEVETALREALANAIRHGCKGDPAQKVECCVACDESRGILIVVRDPGSGFDPESLPSPIVGQNVFSAGGRGIYLINQLMDEVHFEKGGTEIHMRKG
jgi:serine/threonine-protein kinase RsbW